MYTYGMKMKIMPHAVFTAFAALIASAAFSATSYVVPWYVNPALRAQVRLGDEAPRVTSLALDPSGAFLALGAEANGAFENIQAYKAAELAAATGVVTNGFTGRLASAAAGLGEAPLVAVHAAAGVVAVNADLSAGARFPCGANRWIGRMAPEAVTFSAPEPVSAFAFNTEGTAAWANATSDGRTGLVVEWTFAQNAFTRGREIATGLSSVKGLGVYAYNGRTCVVVGEGDAAAATAGEIRLVDTASGVVATLLADREHLGAGIVAVRMSHLGFFRPRLYALLATGDVVCYTCRPEKTSDPALYSRTIPNADLLAAAQAPWTGDHAQVTAFEVFPDGGTAAVAYRRRADDATEPTGPAYLALLKHTPRRWTLYEKDDAGNPRLGVAPTLTDGLWQLNYTWGSSGDIWIGFNDYNTSGTAWVNGEMHEYLDFSGGVAYKASTGSAQSICGNFYRSLGTNAVSRGKGPRVLLHSPRMNNFGDRAKQWEGEGNYEEVVIDVPNLTWMLSWSGPTPNQKYIIYNMPRLGEAPPVMLYANNGKYYGDLCRFEEQNFEKLTIVRDRAFQNWNASGVLSLPKATVLSNDCFRSCRYMTEARLGTTATATMQFFSAAFSGNTALKKVTLGSAGGVHFHAANVFANCPLEEVTLGGPVPTADDGLSIVWPDTAERTMVFAVPRGDAAWEAVLADPNKLKTRLTEAEQEAFFVAHPGRHIPFGVVDKSVFRTRHDQLVAYNDQPGGYALTIERDTFFDDAVAVASDRAPTADGRYMPGTTVTLTATPNATGAFRRWYGDVPGGAADQATLTLTLTNDVWLYCRFVHPWTLAPDRKTASNGNFTVNCRVADASARTLALGNGAWGGLYAADDVGQGVCDLGGPVFEGDATPWTFVKFLDAGGALCGLKHGKGAADTLLSPGTLRTMTTEQFLHLRSTPDARSYRMFIFDEPTMTGRWGSWATCGQFDLTRLILRLPSLTAFAGDACLWQMPLSETKFDWWDLRGLTTLTGNAWAAQEWNYWAPASGNLALPALRTVVRADRSPSLAKMPAVEAIALGGRTKADTVTNLCQGAFTRDTKLRSLTLYNGADLVVGAKPLEETPALREIWLQGPAPSGEAVSNLFSSVKAEATKPLKLYVSRLMKGWTTAAYLDAPTAAEKAEAPGEKVFAVYRGAGAAAGTGKALVIHRAGPYDPANTILYFR